MNFWWMNSSFLALGDVIEFRTREAYSSLVPNSDKYNINQQSKVDMEKMIDWMKPNTLTDWEKI